MSLVLDTSLVCLTVLNPWNKGFPHGSVDKESAHNAGDQGLIPGLGRSPGEGYSYPLQCSGLEESGRLQSMGSQRVRHDGATSLSFFLSLSLE